MNNKENTSLKPKNARQKPINYITEQIKVEKFIPGGQTIATLENGKKIFLWGALPEEVVTKVRVTKEKSSFVEGIAEEVLVKSKFRVQPKDECYLATSPWQILDYSREMSEKVKLIKEIFRQHEIDLSTFELNSQDQDFDLPYSYRNKMEYALYYSYADSKIHLAFHERGSHRKIPITKSSLEHPKILEKAQEIIAELNAKGEDARKYQSLLLRCNQKGEVSGGLFENHRPHPKFAKLKDQLFGITYSYSPNGFFQINLPVYAKALTSILNTCESGPQPTNVLDLYSGVGTIGLSIAREHQLTLVECDKSAYDEMLENVKTASSITQNSQIKPILAKSEDALEYIEPDQTVIVDPPRAGCRPEVINKFLEIQPKSIIYLSCNPATQARDIKLLLDKYQITKIEAFNFFPRTPHIENLVVLKLKNI